jgi:hypothetical protein
MDEKCSTPVLQYMTVPRRGRPRPAVLVLALLTPTLFQCAFVAIMESTSHATLGIARASVAVAIAAGVSMILAARLRPVVAAPVVLLYIPMQWKWLVMVTIVCSCFFGDFQ